MNNPLKIRTCNNNGLFHTEEVKGKMKDVLKWENCEIVDSEGIGISPDIRPKFSDWSYINYIEQLKQDRSVLFLEPMSAYEDSEYLIRKELKEDEIAELKMDGHRGTVHIGEEANRVFSRRISKKTDWFSENTDQVPHIRDMILEEYKGTVLDGEFDYGTTSMGVQSVMGSLPANAIQYQFKNGFIKFFAFDILYYKGVNVQKMPLWKRKMYLLEVIEAFKEIYETDYIEFTKMYAHKSAYDNLLKISASYFMEVDLEEHLELVDDYNRLMGKVLSEDKEGLMIKNVHSVYEQKKTKNMIKLKGQSTWDVIIIGTTPPTKLYDGKLVEEGRVEEWTYWYNSESDSIVTIEKGQKADAETMALCDPVTKPFAMGWCGAVEFAVVREESWDAFEEFCGGDVYTEIAVDQMQDEGVILELDYGKRIKYLQHVGDCKGIADSVLEDIRINGDTYIKEKRVLEVKANGIIDKQIGSLRHPRFSRWRDDKGWEMCTWEDHIRELGK